MKNTRKNYENQGMVYAISVNNNWLHAKKRISRMADYEWEKIATTDFMYDIFCYPKDVDSIVNILG